MAEILAVAEENVCSYLKRTGGLTKCNGLPVLTDIIRRVSIPLRLSIFPELLMFGSSSGLPTNHPREGPL